MTQETVQEKRDLPPPQGQQDRQRTQDLAADLEEERHILQTIMENTHAHLAYLDPQLNFVRVNSAYAQGSGYSREELLGRNHFDLFPHAENQAIFEQVRDTGEPVAFHAKPFVYPDRPELGTTYWDWTLIPVKNEVGQVQGLVLSLLDVTERERAEEALRRNADLMQVLHEIDQAILAAHSAQEIAEAALPQLRKLVPCLRSSVTLFDFEANEMSLLAARADGNGGIGAGTRFPMEILGEDIEALCQGDVYWVEDVPSLSHSSPLIQALQASGVRSYINVPLIAHGELIGSLNLGAKDATALTPEHVDIAREVADQLAIGIQQAHLYEQVQDYAGELEQRVAERTAELWASETRFRTLFEKAAIGMALVDRESQVVESNPALQDMLGYSRAELRGRVFTQMCHPDDAPADLDPHRELEPGESNRYRTAKRLIRRDGQAIWTHVTGSLIRGAGGELQFAIWMVEDITEQKRTQAALLQAEKLAIAGKLAASLAHEINNPLQSIIGCLGLAQETLAEGGDVGRYLQVALEELRRVARIVARLRNLHRPSRIEEREPTDVNALLKQVLTLSRTKCKEHRVEVAWREAADLPSLLLVPDRVQQVFLNLVLNAIDAMPEGGQLQISATSTSEPAGVAITFADNGTGISPDALPHIFDVFYSTKPDGLGLGLSISHDIVKQHGGYVDVESLVGEGSTFTVWLPA